MKANIIIVFNSKSQFEDYLLVLKLYVFIFLCILVFEQLFWERIVSKVLFSSSSRYIKMKNVVIYRNTQQLFQAYGKTTKKNWVKRYGSNIVMRYNRTFLHIREVGGAYIITVSPTRSIQYFCWSFDGHCWKCLRIFWTADFLWYFNICAVNKIRNCQMVCPDFQT